MARSAMPLTASSSMIVTRASERSFDPSVRSSNWASPVAEWISTSKKRLPDMTESFVIGIAMCFGCTS